MTNLVKRNAYAEGRECGHRVKDTPHAGRVSERYRDAALRAITGDEFERMVAAAWFHKGFMRGIEE
mgnify:CR=1 FL=1